MKYIYKNRNYSRLFSVIDAVGGFVFDPFRSVHAGEEYERILIIRLDHIGDVIASTPVIAPLKKRFPSARLDMMVPSWAKEIVENDPAIDNVIVFDPKWFRRGNAKVNADLKGLTEMVKLVKSGGYDLAIDLRGDFRGILAMFLAGVGRRISYGITGGGFLLTDEVSYDRRSHETERNIKLLAPLGIKVKEPAVSLCFGEGTGWKAGSLLEKHKVHGKYAVLHPFPGDPAKSWTGEGFTEVSKHLADKGITPVIIGTGKDSHAAEGYGQAVNLCGETSVSEAAAIIKGCVIFIGVDSGPAHIAAYSRVPTVILFAPVNDPYEWAPRADNVRVLCPGPSEGLSGVKAAQAIDTIDAMLRKERVI